MKKMKKGIRRFRDSVEAYACRCACDCSCNCSCNTAIGSFSRNASTYQNGSEKTAVFTGAANEI